VLLSKLCLDRWADRSSFPGWDQLGLHLKARVDPEVAKVWRLPAHHALELKGTSFLEEREKQNACRKTTFSFAIQPVSILLPTLSNCLFSS
jgi:hypothetical protein